MKRILHALYTFFVLRVRAIWLGVGVPGLALYAAYLFRSPNVVTADERAVIAALLEFGGLVLIALGYVQLRQEFGRPGVLQSLKAYFADLWAAVLPSRPRTIHASAASSLGLTGSARMTLRAGPNAPIERRLEIIESRVEAMDKELQSLTDRMSGELSSLRAQLSGIKAEIDKEVQALKVLVEHASIGDAGSEVVGWLWLLSGIVLSSWPSWGALLSAAP